MWDQILSRAMRVVQLDRTVFSEIEHDETANTEAAVVVIVTSFLAALGEGLGTGSVVAFLLSLFIGPLIGWLLWSWVTMFVGTRMFEGEADFWEVARTLGYANVPMALGLLAFIPCVGWIISLAAWVLSLVVGFFAVREALDLTTERTIMTIIIGWVIVLVVRILVGITFGLGAVGAGLLI